MKVFLLCLILFLAAPLISQTQGTGTQTAKPAAKPAIFDPTRDAAKDIQQAIAEAARTGKNVLIDVGGNWCSWCHEMERYFETHPELRAIRDNNFVTVKVNWSPENKNEAVLSKYPKIPGYPHLFVLDKNGTLLHSQDTARLEDGKRSYDLEKFTAFLKEWSPQAKKPHQVLGEIPFSYSYVAPDFIRR
jgi:thiol:disulfide interchange protein